jgi:hypothetical protein
VAITVGFLALDALASQYASVVDAQCLCRVTVEEVGIAMTDDLFGAASEQLANLAIDVLITQLRVLDVDMRLDAVEDGIEVRFAGLEMSGLVRDLAA